jgi:hypothetical protein
VNGGKIRDKVVASYSLLHYARNMYRFLFFILSILSYPVSAVICKTINEQGNVSYADVPAGQCQNQVTLPELSTYAPRPLAETTAPANDRAGTNGDAFAGYTEFLIQQPEQNGTVRNNEGTVPVLVVLEPRLQEDHQLRLVLDGIPVAPPFRTLSATLSGVDRGSHSLQVEVLDGNGNILRSAGPVSFTVHQAIVRKQPRQ